MKKVVAWFSTETHSSLGMLVVLAMWFAINHIAVQATVAVGLQANEPLYVLETVIREQGDVFHGLEPSLIRTLLLVLGLLCFVVIQSMGIGFALTIGGLIITGYAVTHLIFGAPFRAGIEWLYFFSAMAIFAKTGGLNGRRIESIMGLSGVSVLHIILLSIQQEV